MSGGKSPRETGADPRERSPAALNYRGTRLRQGAGGRAETQRNRKNVITGLDPVIHGTACANGAMDARVKPAHDSFFSLASAVQGGQAARRHPCPGGLSGERAKKMNDLPHAQRAFARFGGRPLPRLASDARCQTARRRPNANRTGTPESRTGPSPPMIGKNSATVKAARIGVVGRARAGTGERA